MRTFGVRWGKGPRGARTDQRPASPSPSGARTLIAVSGGPDSMALAALLAERGRGGPAWAHLNHRLRGAEADADEAFVRKQARSAGARLFVRREDAAAFARARHLSIEEAGRVLRYRFFEEIALRHGFRAVATGHTADDDAVTILSRLLRGTGLRGLRGIPRRRPIRPGSPVEVVRPLLGWRRERVIAFLRRRNCPYRVDATNDDPRFERNRLRSWIASEIRAGRDPVPALLSVGAMARRLYRPIEREIRRALPRLAPGANAGPRLDRGAFEALPERLRAEALRLAAEEGSWGGRPSSIHFDTLQRWLEKGRTGSRCDWPGNRQWLMERGGCAILLPRNAAHTADARRRKRPPPAEPRDRTGRPPLRVP